MVAFWYDAQCSLVEVDRRFRCAYCVFENDDCFITLVMEAAKIVETLISAKLHGANFP
jgi:hypothetical protein